MKNAQWKKIALKKVRINLLIKKRTFTIKEKFKITNETISTSRHVSSIKYSIDRENITNWIKHMK